MENFIVSARKYRPSTFESVVGQGHITSTLKNAIRNHQLAQAFLFCGPRGVGKTTCARILAKTINCQNLTPETEACGTCDSCRSFQNGNSFSIHELDAASNNSVDDIRSLIEQVRIPPQTGKYKIYIIDEVHMLSQAAFNAFLKTLEEPPSYAIFILATTEKHKILPTILSRCQIFDFNRIRVDDMAAHLASIAGREAVNYDQDGLHLIAQKADGGLRDALSMFDQIVSFSNRNVTYRAVIDNLNILDYDYYFKVTDALLKEDLTACLLLLDDILANGFDGNNFISGLAGHFRNLLVGKDPATLRLLEVSDGIRQKYLEQSKQASASFLLSGLNIANQCDLTYKNSKNQRLQVELALLKIGHLPAAFSIAASPTGEEVKKKPDSEAITSPASPATTAAPPPVAPLPPAVTVSEATASPATRPEPSPAAAPPPAPAAPATASQEASAKLPVKPVLKPAASIIPNLNDLGSAKAEEEDDSPKYIAGDSREAFSPDQFLSVWNKYAEDVKRAGKINLFTILTANPPVLLGPETIAVTIENKIQENQLATEKIDLLNHLRVQLRNFSIDVVSRMMEKNEKRRLYTSHEKYQHMAEKNPSLEEFRRKFNLEVE
jgi:DNA polymerase III subunit gamma/tau